MLEQLLTNTARLIALDATYIARYHQTRCHLEKKWIPAFRRS